MLIVCPSCARRYSLPADKIGAQGRTVRCASCRTQFFVPPPEEDEAVRPAGEGFDDVAFRDENAAGPAAPIEAAAVEDSPAAFPSEPEAAAPRRRRLPRLPRIAWRPPPALARIGSRFGAPALLTLILVAGVIAIVKREAVVRAAPQTAKVFAAIRMPVNLRGLVFRDVKSETVWEGTTRYLVVEGEIVNVAQEAVPVAPVSITVRSADGGGLYTWSVEPMRPRLEAGQKMAFRARLASPPPDGQNVVVVFAKDGGATQANASPR